MRDYTKMYLLHRLSSERLELVSEMFIEKTEAEKFAEILIHNYKVKPDIVPSWGNDGYVVFAKFEKYSVRSNLDIEYDHYTFANWKFNTR